MRRSLFREGGPNKIRRTGLHEYEMSITLPQDAQGRVARECPNSECTPAYFKVKLGTGITEGQKTAYCPYCRHAAQPNKFTTEGQMRYGKDMMLKEAHQGVNEMMKEALGLGPSGRKRFGGGPISFEMTFKPGRPPSVRRPFEEVMQRDVVCPHCGLDHVVFGLATWCADCGRDIFLTHVTTEYEIVRKMVGDIDRRREALGARVAVRDAENALEDVVSIYEAALKAMITRSLKASGSSDNDIHSTLRKVVGNPCQSIPRSAEVVDQLLHVHLLAPLSHEETATLTRTFEKRHPITHNLGIVDRKYLARGLSAEREGREIHVTPDEVVNAIALCLRVLEALQSRLFQETSTH